MARHICKGFPSILSKKWLKATFPQPLNLQISSGFSFLFAFFCFSFRPKRKEKEGAALYFSALFFLIVKHAVAVPLKVGVGYLLPELLAHALGIVAYLPHAGAMAVALAEALPYQLHYLLVLIKPHRQFLPALLCHELLCDNHNCFLVLTDASFHM